MVFSEELAVDSAKVFRELNEDDKVGLDADRVDAEVGVAAEAEAEAVDCEDSSTIVAAENEEARERESTPPSTSPTPPTPPTPPSRVDSESKDMIESIESTD